MGIEADWSAIRAAARAEKTAARSNRDKQANGTNEWLDDRAPTRATSPPRRRRCGSPSDQKDRHQRQSSRESSRREAPLRLHRSAYTAKVDVVKRYRSSAGQRSDSENKAVGASYPGSTLIFQPADELDDPTYLDANSRGAELLDTEKLFDEELQALQRRYVKRDLYRRYLGVNQVESELPTFVEVPPDILNDFSAANARITPEGLPPAEQRVEPTVCLNRRSSSRHSPAPRRSCATGAAPHNPVSLRDKRCRSSQSPSREREHPDLKARRHDPKTHRAEIASPEIVFRDRFGKRIREHEWLEQQRKLKPGRGGFAPSSTGPGPVAAKRARSKVEPVEWGPGMKQARDEQLRREEEALIIKQPFTRYTIDSSHDKEIQEGTRWEDPMRFFSPSSPQSSPEESSSRKMEAAKEDPMDVDDFIQRTEATKRKRRICPFTTPPNRYGIPAGYRWDGVIRGNGFEARLLSHRAPREPPPQLADDF